MNFITKIKVFLGLEKKPTEFDLDIIQLYADRTGLSLYEAAVELKQDKLLGRKS